MKLGIKPRMTLWNAVIMAVFIAAGFAWVHFGLRSVLNSRNARFLDRKASELMAAVTDSVSGGPEALEAEIRREAQTYAKDGLIVVLRKPEAIEVVPAEMSGLANDAGFVDLWLPNDRSVFEKIMGKEYLMHRIRVQAPEGRGQDYPLDLLLTLDETHQVSNQFDRRAAMGGAAFMALATIGGYVFARQALRPVEASIRTARELRPEQFDARLPLAGTGDELDELAITINQLLDRLASYNSQIIRFTADASHELRSPLSAMRAMVEVALHESRSIPEYRDVLESVLEQSDKLTMLVDALLLLARADAGEVQIRRESIDAARIIGDVIDLFQPLAEEKSIDIIFVNHEPAVIEADSQRMRQLMTNLIDNAIKFTHRQGTITVRIDCRKDEIRILTEDNGIGIPEDQLDAVFRRFHQVDSSRSDFGSGLGLSICRWICNAHGGSIKAERVNPQGTRIIATLPMRSPV